ncbi:MAG: phosphatidylglycerophosphatase A [Prevotella sp.]|nr:phosphatidylglycerophosphatase A [Prevotella sp.]MBQ6031690.1 phosphatidylglycerophosphatase A [Prevotella sp.]
MKRPPLFAHILTTGFGSGYCPLAPGTAGAVLAVLLWLLASLWLSPVVLFYTTLAVIFLFTILGIVCTNQVIPFWGEDPRRVVVDEMVGVWIPLAVVNPGEWLYIIASLVLFRFFDIVKPLGVRKMENLPGGIGVMADDILAGIYSLVIILIAKCVL